MPEYDPLLKSAQDRTLAALEDARKANLHQLDPASAELPENERITGVRCRRQYIGIVPWSVCLNCWAHCHTVYDLVKRPVVTCRVNGKQEQTQTVYDPKEWRN